MITFVIVTTTRRHASRPRAVAAVDVGRTIRRRHATPAAATTCRRAPTPALPVRLDESGTAAKHGDRPADDQAAAHGQR